jgi:hypothetical protein
VGAEVSCRCSPSTKSAVPIPSTQCPTGQRTCRA